MKTTEQRKNKRLKVKTGIAKNPAGVFQIINLNPEGLSFKCVKRGSFSREWSLDIYDTSGLNLGQLQVKKIWEKCLSNLDVAACKQTAIELIPLTIGSH